MDFQNLITIGSTIFTILVSVAISSYKIGILKEKYETKINTLETEVEKLKSKEDNNKILLEQIKYALNLVLDKLGIKIEEHKQI
jgi:hypothetical protein